MTEDGLNLVLLLEGNGGVGVGTSHNIVLVELVEILDVIYVVWYFATTTRHADLICRDLGLFLLLGVGAII